MPARLLVRCGPQTLLTAPHVSHVLTKHASSCGRSCPHNGTVHPIRADPGYYAPAGAVSQTPCGGASVYCPGGTAKPLPVGEYNESVGGDGHYTRTGQQICPDGSFCVAGQAINCSLGHYCQGGPQIPCPAGYVGNAAGLSDPECSGPCPKYHYCEAGTSRPQRCPEGKWGNQSGLHDASECQDCPLGQWCSGGQPFPCANDTYSVDRGLRTSQDDCKPCGAHSGTLQWGASSIAECVCDENYYKTAADSTDCIPCPIGTRCAGSGALLRTLWLQQGFWRISRDSADIRPCPTNETCQGGSGMNPNSTDANPKLEPEPTPEPEPEPEPKTEPERAHENATSATSPDYCNSAVSGIDPAVPYCSHCIDPNEYLDSDICRSCRSPRIALGIYGGVVVALSIAAWLFVRLAPWHVVHLRQLALLVARRASPMAKGKQIVGFYQIVTNMHHVYGVVMPPKVVSMQRHFEVFNLNIFALYGLQIECYFLPTFTSQLLARALTPLVLIVACVGYYWCRKALHRAIPSTLWITFLVFSLVSSPAFEVFDCEQFEKDNQTISFLRADYTVTCSIDGVRQPEYNTLWILAIVVILIFPVGIPILYAILLFGPRSSTMAQKLDFLTANYRRQFYYWELIETFKRLLLASFFALPFLGHGTLTQLLIALAAQIVFLILQVYARPFHRQSDNFFACIVNVMLTFAFFCCCVLKQDELVELVESTSGELPDHLYQRYTINIGLVTAVLLTFSFLLLVGMLCILAQSLASIQNAPVLCWHRDDRVAEAPSIEGWHAFISHVWRTGQVKAFAAP
jgi:hypothetical protein